MARLISIGLACAAVAARSGGAGGDQRGRRAGGLGALFLKMTQLGLVLARLAAQALPRLVPELREPPEDVREGADSEGGRAELGGGGEPAHELWADAQAKLRELGVSGIPTLILAGKWQMPSGAMGASSLVDAFRQLEEMGGGTGSMFAEALAIPDTVMEETLVL